MNPLVVCAILGCASHLGGCGKDHHPVEERGDAGVVSAQKYLGIDLSSVKQVPGQYNDFKQYFASVGEIAFEGGFSREEFNHNFERACEWVHDPSGGGVSPNRYAEILGSMHLELNQIVMQIAKRKMRKAATAQIALDQEESVDVFFDLSHDSEIRSMRLQIICRSVYFLVLRLAREDADPGNRYYALQLAGWVQSNPKSNVLDIVTGQTFLFMCRRSNAVVESENRIDCAKVTFKVRQLLYILRMTKGPDNYVPRGWVAQVGRFKEYDETFIHGFQKQITLTVNAGTQYLACMRLLAHKLDTVSAAALRIVPVNDEQLEKFTDTVNLLFDEEKKVRTELFKKKNPPLEKGSSR